MDLQALCRHMLAALLAATSVSCGGSSDDPAPQPQIPTPRTAGLDERPNNLTCVAPPRVTGSSTLAVERAFPALTFVEPVAMLQAPGDDSRWFVVERRGIVRVFANEQTVATSQVFLDIVGQVVQLAQSEAGLLGLAFHPDFASNGRVYVNYTAQFANQLRSVTAELTSPDGGLTIDPNSLRVLLSVNKRYDNHNGGQLAFGPDGFLYLGLGDGGGANDPDGNGQNRERLLGKMLRIDVDTRPNGAPYAIPGGALGNPFAGNALCNVDGTGTQACPEIYALGFRNPWRWSFDPQTGELWAGDVGQSTFEEIDVVTRGANYGWDTREGFECAGGGTSCNSAGFTDPVAAYGRSVGFSVTGGHVYRGSQTTELTGRYVFGDYGGMIASLTPSAGGTFTVTRLVNNGQAPAGAPGPLSISAFGRGNDGELFALDYGRGHLYRLLFTSSGGTSGDNVPQQLSATGCIDTSSPAAPLASLIPYSVNASFWSDGAAKQRAIGLPNGRNIAVPNSGDWEPPNGTVLVEHFRLGGQLVETRLLMRHPDGVWGGYTYRWNGSQTDATRVTGGATADVAGQQWVFPSETQCLQCHTQAAGVALGLETAQLNRDHTYAQTGRTANQLTTLNAINVLSPPVVPDSPAYADPADSSRSLGDRARAYLHTNCAHCHRPDGPTATALDLRHDATLLETGTCDAAPARGDLGIANARIIAPGDGARSVLLARMSRRDADAMPPLASTVVDTAGAQLVGAWIDSLTAASCR